MKGYPATKRILIVVLLALCSLASPARALPPGSPAAASVTTILYGKQFVWVVTVTVERDFLTSTEQIELITQVDRCKSTSDTNCVRVAQEARPLADGEHIDISSQSRVATLSIRWLGKPLTYSMKPDGRFQTQGYDTAIVSHGNRFEQINTSISTNSLVGVKLLGLKKACKAQGLLITGSSATAERQAFITDGQPTKLSP